MASLGSPDSISDRAAEWAVEVAHGDLTPEGRAVLDAWLAADRRHRGAFVRARAWLKATETAVIEARPEPVAAEPVPVSDNDNGAWAEDGAGRRLLGWGGRLLAAGTALAACVAAVMISGVSLWPARAPQVAAAERVVNLKDGSVATLSRDARIEVALSDSIRRVTLLSGKATFQVAKDKARPFVVRSGDVYAQATGTVYSVGRVGTNGGTIHVTQGSVLVWLCDERDQAMLLRAGDMVTLNPGPRLPPVPAATATPRLPPPELAQISLDNVPVSKAVVRFNRVNSTRIVVGDPGIGKIRIIGLYRANDPERFAEAVAIIAGGRIEHERGAIVIKANDKDKETPEASVDQ